MSRGSFYYWLPKEIGGISETTVKLSDKVIHYEDPDIIHFTKLFGEVDTCSILVWNLAISKIVEKKQKITAAHSGNEDKTAQDKMIKKALNHLSFHFHSNGQSTFVITVDRLEKKYTIDCIPYADKNWNDPKMINDILLKASLEDAINKMVNEIGIRPPQGQKKAYSIKNFEREVHFYFSHSISKKLGFGDIFYPSSPDFEKAQKKLMELNAQQSLPIKEGFLKDIQWKRYADGVKRVDDNFQNLGISMDEFCRKMRFLTFHKEDPNFFTGMQVLDFIDKYKISELDLPMNYEIKEIDPKMLNRIFFQSYEELKKGLTSFKNPVYFLLDPYSSYQSIFGAMIQSEFSKKDYRTLFLPISVGTTFQVFYSQFVNALKAQRLLPLEFLVEYSDESMEMIVEVLEKNKIFLTISELNYLDQIDCDDSRNFFAELLKLNAQGLGKVLLSSSKAIDWARTLPTVSLPVYEIDKDFRSVHEIVKENFKYLINKYHPEFHDRLIEIDLGRKDVEALYHNANDNPAALFAVIKDLYLEYESDIINKRRIDSSLIKNYLIQEKEDKLKKNLGKKIKDLNTQKMFFYQMLSFLFDNKFNHLITQFEVESDRSIKTVNEDGSFNWVRFSPDPDQQSLKALAIEIDKLYERHEKLEKKNELEKHVDEKYVLLNHRNSHRSEELSLFQTGLFLFKLHLVRHPYFIESGFKWNDFIKNVLREHYGRDDVADLFEKLLNPKMFGNKYTEFYKKFLEDIPFLIQFSVKTLDEDAYDSIMRRSPLNHRSEVEGALFGILRNLGKTGAFIARSKVMESLLDSASFDTDSLQVAKELKMTEMKQMHYLFEDLHSVADENMAIRVAKIPWDLVQGFKYNEVVNNYIRVISGIDDENKKNNKSLSLDTIFKNLLEKTILNFNEIAKSNTYTDEEKHDLILKISKTIRVLRLSLRLALSGLMEIREQAVDGFFVNPIIKLDKKLVSYLSNIKNLKDVTQKIKTDLEAKAKNEKVSDRYAHLIPMYDIEIDLLTALNNDIGEHAGPSEIKESQIVKMIDSFQNLIKIVLPLGTLFSGAAYFLAKLFFWAYYQFMPNPEIVQSEIEVNKNMIHKDINRHYKYLDKDAKFADQCDALNDCVKMLTAESMMLPLFYERHPESGKILKNKMLEMLTVLEQNYLLSNGKRTLQTLLEIPEYKKDLTNFFQAGELDEPKLLKLIHQKIGDLNAKYPDVKPQPKVDIKK